MSYLIDTDVVVNWLKDLEDNGLAISLITYGEIYDGIYYSHDPDGNEKAIEQFLQWVDVLSLEQ